MGFYATSRDGPKLWDAWEKLAMHKFSWKSHWKNTTCKTCS